MSRLHAGAVQLACRPVHLEDAAPVAWSAAGTPVRIEARSVGAGVRRRVIDRGPASP